MHPGLPAIAHMLIIAHTRRCLEKLMVLVINTAGPHIPVGTTVEQLPGMQLLQAIMALAHFMWAAMEKGPGHIGQGQKMHFRTWRGHSTGGVHGGYGGNARKHGVNGRDGASAFVVADFSVGGNGADGENALDA